MKTYTLRVTLEANTLIGSGEGFGAVIDADIVFDDTGLPYIPAKRVKGCLRDSAQEVCAMLEKSGITSFLDLTRCGNDNRFTIVDDLFGRPGQEAPAPLHFSSLRIEDYEANRTWLKYLASKHTNLLSGEGILSFFTEIRPQTAIDAEGIAKEHSLRTLRTIKKDKVFEGELQYHLEDKNAERLLGLACLNLRRMGTKRNRGFGKIRCEIHGLQTASILKELEVLCTN